jgi:adenosylcobinamide kinase/adenosylcobinamide-phosphate guanylyltransferase
MGMHADTVIGRKFTDLQGWMNQYIAQKADKVIFMVSGIPMTIKAPQPLKGSK